MQRYVAASRDGEAEHNVGLACQAMQEDRGRGCHELRQAGSAAARDRFETICVGALQVRGVTEEGGGFAGALVPETDPFRPVAQAVKPVSPITGKLLRSPVGGILIEQVGQFAKDAAKPGRSDLEFGVDVGKALCDQRHAETVHHDVMVARVPEEAVGRDFE